jgi:hypothetical protein
MPTTERSSAFAAEAMQTPVAIAATLDQVRRRRQAKMQCVMSVSLTSFLAY